MNEIIRAIEAEQIRTDFPNFNVGDNVKVYVKIKEGNKRKNSNVRRNSYKETKRWSKRNFHCKKISLRCWS